MDTSTGHDKQMFDIRSDLGLSQSQMARLLGYGDKKDISRIENGNRKMGNQTLAHLDTLDHMVLLLGFTNAKREILKLLKRK